MSGNEGLYPKVTEPVTNLAEQIANEAGFIALATGIFKDMHAAKNNSASVCLDGEPLVECDAAKQVMSSTMERLSQDSNPDFTGWVGYEQANVDCEKCPNSCSARVFWEDGMPTERTKFLFYKKVEPDMTITINLGSTS